MDRRAFVAALGGLPLALDAAAARLGTVALPGVSRTAALHAAPRPRPSRAQLAWQRDELAMFVHFGLNTFTDREWGDGTENPSIFDPSALDARQWARTATAPA